MNPADTVTVTHLIEDLVSYHCEAELADHGANNGTLENLAIGRVTYELNIDSDAPLTAGNIDEVVQAATAYLTGDEIGEAIATAIAIAA